MGTREFFERVEAHRYAKEWHIPEAAGFAAARGLCVLEIGCGLGTDGAQFAAAGANYTGIDLTDAAVEFAKRRFELFELPGTFRIADAERLDFPDNSFDIVTVGYGLRNLASWERGLEEMRRVAKPGGRLLVLDFGKPENALWRKMYFAYLRCIVPVFGRIFCGDSETHAYILESLLNFPAQRGVAARMRAMNCRETQIFDLLGGALSINFARK